MDAYIVESAKNNGQLIIDLPVHLHNKNVKITIDEIISTTPPTESFVNLRPELEEVEAIIPPRKKVDLTQLIGAFSKNPIEIEDEDDSDFWQPRKRSDITKLRGALKLNMTIEEIDLLTKSWRDEWERDFS